MFPFFFTCSSSGLDLGSWPLSCQRPSPASTQLLNSKRKDCISCILGRLQLLSTAYNKVGGAVNIKTYLVNLMVKSKASDQCHSNTQKNLWTTQSLVRDRTAAKLLFTRWSVKLFLNMLTDNNITLIWCLSLCHHVPQLKHHSSLSYVFKTN